jgi:thermitase
MTSPEDRLAQWRQRRQERLERLPHLRHTTVHGSRAWFVSDEMLVVDDEREVAESVLRDAGHPVDAAAEVVPGLRRYRAAGLDVAGVVRQVHERRWAGRPHDGPPVAGRNHVFLGSPFNHGGGGLVGPPVPAAALAAFAVPTTEATVPVAIVDGGAWKASPLPDGYFRAGAVEYEDRSDVDGDGYLDGDIGHANFIAGVIVASAPQAQLSVLKVLDTFGICTEDQLVAALARVADDVRVVNLSLGGLSVDGQAPVGLRIALSGLLTGHDRVVVAAAGNNGDRVNPFWPAAFAGTDEAWASQVVAVAAHDGTALCSWSDLGEWVSLAAHGEDVTSTFIQHEQFPSGWARWSGTSFAAPRVAAALVAGIAAGASAADALRAVRVVASENRYPGPGGVECPGLP